MAAATDFLHDRAIMEALKTVIAANLTLSAPEWMDTSNHRWGLSANNGLKIGRAQDYALTDDEGWRDFTPCILIRSMRDEVQGWALGGSQEVDHPIRIVHLFHRTHCVDSAGDSIEPHLAQVDRAKILVPCILRDTDGNGDFNLTAASLTTTDATAEIIKGTSRVTGVYWDGRGVEFPAGPYWSVVIDYNVQTVTEG